jgi:hypothetical protein
MGHKDKMTSQVFNLSLVNLLESDMLSDVEMRHLIGWQALLLVDLLQRRCITVRYAERALFNLDMVRRLEQRRLQDCVELLDWGMQLEDWEEHTPEQLHEALTSLAQLARNLLPVRSTSTSIPSEPAQQRKRRRQHQQEGESPVLV